MWGKCSQIQIALHVTEAGAANAEIDCCWLLPKLTIPSHGAKSDQQTRSSTLLSPAVKAFSCHPYVKTHKCPLMSMGLLQQIPASRKQHQPESRPTTGHEGFAPLKRCRMEGCVHLSTMVGTSSHFVVLWGVQMQSFTPGDVSSLGKMQF